MAYFLVGPTVKETPAAYDRLMRRFGIDRGITIIRRMDGSYYQTRYPAQTELEEAAAYYLGGHEYPLSDQEVTDLTAAGFGSYIVVR